MIAHMVAGLQMSAPDRDDIEMMLDGEISAQRVFLQNDSYFYMGSYAGPSNSGPGWLWNILGDQVFDEVEWVSRTSPRFGSLDIWRARRTASGDYWYIVTQPIGYSYHLRANLFMHKGTPGGSLPGE